MSALKLMQTNNTNNIVGFTSNTFASAVELFLDEHLEFSKNTARSYAGNIKEFFMYIIGKQLENITWDDIINLKYENTMKYRNYLKKNKKNANSTINQKIASIKALFKHLKKFNYEINTTVVDLKPLPERNQTNSYGALTLDELNKLYSYCDNEKQKPLTKKLFFKTAIITGLRKSAILNIKWNDIKQKRDKNSGNMVWTIYTENDKGKELFKSIPSWFHDELMELKISKENKSECKVFDIYDRTLDVVLKKFCEDNNISEDRNIVIHSLKKTSMDMVWENTRDIMKTADQGNHSSLEMARKNYLNKNNSLEDQPSFMVFNEDNSIDNFENLSREQLLQLIKNSNKFVQNELKKDIHKVL